MPSPRMSLGAALLTVAALVVSACGTEQQPDNAGRPPASSSPSPDESPSAAESPSKSPEPSPTPSETATATPSPAAGLGALLPSDADLPGLNAQWRWAEESTGPASSEPFGACAPVGIMSLGAERGVERRYAAGDGSESTAGALAVRFADRASAERVRRVLVSLRDRCSAKLEQEGRANVLVSPLQPVSGTTSKAAWYLVRSTEPGSEVGTFHAFGMATHGKRMVLLTMDSPGQDYNYPPGQEPMVQALQRVDKVLAPAG